MVLHRYSEVGLECDRIQLFNCTPLNCRRAQCATCACNHRWSRSCQCTPQRRPHSVPFCAVFNERHLFIKRVHQLTREVHRVIVEVHRVTTRAGRIALASPPRSQHAQGYLSAGSQQVAPIVWHLKPAGQSIGVSVGVKELVHSCKAAAPATG